MGEAIARFREMALVIRRICDERHSQPRGGAVTEAAAKKFTKECRLHLLDHEKNGMTYVERYVRGLCRRRNEAERHPEPPPSGHFDLPYYIHWLPKPFAKEEPGYSEVRNEIREAIKEAVKWGSLFPEIEARIKALHAAADMLLQYAGAGFYQPPTEKYWCEAEDGKGGGYCTPTGKESDSDYIDCHEKFAEAFDALAPFVEEPPAPAATTGQKTSSSRRSGRPQNDEELARDLLKGWRAYEPEEGRKTKDRYLAQRPDVRVVKTEDARQRRIASLRVALNSALHLHNEKTKQKQRLRG
jgi:hypothetical protein